MVGTTSISTPDWQHLVMEDVDWGFYEHVLAKIGDRALRVTFNEGRIEIMSPLPQHEMIKRAVQQLIDAIAYERQISMQCLGSTTFRREDQQAGLEPDDCYYIANESLVHDMTQFDAAVYPPPDLAIEVDITNSSVPRQPVYARLGVPELWRFNGVSLEVLLLDDRGNYVVSERSQAMPFLPMDQFEGFIKRMTPADRLKTLREFRDWVRTL